MNRLTFKTIAITGLAAIAMMQASAGILIDQRLTTVMLNDASNSSSKPVAAYECVTWSIFDGRKGAIRDRRNRRERMHHP